jgi:hypothetical protein
LEARESGRTSTKGEVMTNDQVAVEAIELEEITMEEISLREEEEGDIIICQTVF